MFKINHLESNGANNRPRPNSFAVALLLTAMLVLQSGCATQYVHQRHEAQFLPDPVDSSTPIACRLVLTQNDPFIAARKTSPWQVPYDASHGLAGLAVNFAINEVLRGANGIANEIREEEATKKSAPLRGRGLGAQFQNDIQSSLSSALRSSTWLHPLPLTVSRDNRAVTAVELNQHPILDIRLIYNLSYDASILVVQARLFYFKQEETNTEHVCYYTYYSKPIGPEKNEAAVAKWASDNDRLLRERMTEGLDQIIEMLNIDFLRPKWRDPSIPSETISCWDALIQKPVKLKGHIIRKEGSRIIFLSENEKGSILFSIPK